MAELIKTDSEAAWLEARRQGVTASEIAVIMGLSPYSSPYALYHQKLGILPSDVDSAVMERGRVLEPYIAEKFAAAHPELWVHGNGRQLYAHSERPWQLATPDRLLADESHDGLSSYWAAEDEYCDAVLECKSASSMDEWGEPGTDEIPVHYRCQVIWQMDVMGVGRAHVVVLDVPRWQVHEYVIEMDDSARNDLTYMLPAAEEFRRQLAEHDVPDVDWRPATAYALKQLHPSLEDREAHIGRQLEISYRAAVRRYKEAEQRKDEMTNRMREAMGSARRAVTVRTVAGESRQVVIATRQVYDVAESVRKGYTVDKLVAAPSKTKKES